MKRNHLFILQSLLIVLMIVSLINMLNSKTREEFLIMLYLYILCDIVGVTTLFIKTK
jgi:hypothetical protein